MEVRQLEYFLRVMELGSINRAAPTLRLSQPALSRHMALLERELAVKLFTRTQSGVNLTDAGKLMSDRVRPLLRQLALLKEQVGEQAAGQLAIGTPPAWQALFTSPFIEMLVAQYPGVKLRVYEGLSNVQREHMAAGLIDISIIPFSPVHAVGYRQTAIVREPLVLVGRPEDGLSPGQPVALSRLDGVNLVLPERPNVLRVQLERALERKGLQFIVAVETDTLAICLDMARRGVGFSVVPSSALFGRAGDTSISWAPIKGQSITWALWENTARTHSPAVTQGRKLALNSIAAVLARNEWYGAEGLAGLRS